MPNTKTYRRLVTGKRDVNGEKDVKVVIAMTQYLGPADAKEYAEDAAEQFEVTAWTIDPPVVDNGKEDPVIPESAKKPVPSYMVENFKAWEYGAGMLANGPARAAANAGVIEDHIIVINRKATDLAALTPENFVKSVNMLRQATAMGMFDMSPMIAAKVADKLAQHIKAGAVVEDTATGVVSVAKKANGQPVVKK